MVSRFHDKFREDLELIYAKYSNPFDGAPELTLSTCDLPENVQIIEKYSNCGKWMVLGGDSNDAYEDDSSIDEGNNDTSDEESQSSCYDSDDQNSSDCIGSFQLETSFRDKYPRSCAKKGLKTPPSNNKSKKSTDVAKTTPHSHNIHNSAHKQHYYEHEKEQTSSTMTSARHHSSDEYFKSNGTVTLPKDLWSQVQQCLCLMTSVFSQLNGESDDENDREKFSNERPSQRDHSLIKRSSVKQKLFDDDNISCVPQGQVVEKLFVRRKGSGGPGVELASRKTFLHQSTSKISEIESLDSGFCQENSSDVDASTQEYISTSSSACRSTMSGSTSQKMMVSETSEGSCGESFYLKTCLANSSMKSADSSEQLSSGGSCNAKPRCDGSSCLRPVAEFISPTIFGEPSQALSEKKRRRRYRLVRRRSTSCKTQEKSTSETPASGKESDIRESHHVSTNELSFDQCLGDTDDFHIPEKTKKTTVKCNKQSERCSSPEMYDVILVAAPTTPVVQNRVECPQAIPRSNTPLFTRLSLQEQRRSSTPRKIPGLNPGNKTPLLTESNLQGHCRSSTPRKHPGVKNTATKVPDHDGCLKQLLFHKRSNTPADSMPSPIRSTLNYNKHLNETLSNNSFLNNANHSSLSRPKSQNTKDSLPSTISSKSPGSILQPEISVNFLRAKGIRKRRTSSVRDEGKSEKHNTPSSKTQNNDGCPKKLYASLPKRHFSATSPTVDLSKQSVDQECSSNIRHSRNNQRGNLMISIASSNSTSTRSPEVICRTSPFSEPYLERSKSRKELCATDRRLLNSSKSQINVHNSSGKPTTTQSLTTHRERKSKTTTSENRHMKSERYTSSSTSSDNHQRSPQLKITPRRAKFHPYATYNKFPRTQSLTSPFSPTVRSPSLISPFRDLTIKSPSSSRHKWTTLDRSPMAMCVKQARRMSDPVVASRKILEFGSHDARSDLKPTNKTDRRVKDDDVRSKCPNGKCTKTFCFNCSMDLS